MMWIRARIVPVLVVLAVLSPVIGHAIMAYTTLDTVTATVIRVERVSEGTGEHIKHRYMVYADRETFQNSDSLWYLKWNSADVHGRLMPGQTYTFKVYGWRVPFLSWFRNVVEVQ